MYVPFSWSINIYYYNIIIDSVDLYDSPDSVTLDAGVDDDASFSCHGAGSYTYWFINDVNTEDMSLEEITRRRIHIDYLFYSQPYSGCHPQYSYLTLAGNCLNNNTQIYCVILGDMPPPLGGNTTSATANLTVIGIYGWFFNSKILPFVWLPQVIQLWWTAWRYF